MQSLSLRLPAFETHSPEIYPALKYVYSLKMAYVDFGEFGFQFHSF
jgi:hypothetical protein